MFKEELSSLTEIVHGLKDEIKKFLEQHENDQTEVERRREIDRERQRRKRAMSRDTVSHLTMSRDTSRDKVGFPSRNGHVTSTVTQMSRDTSNFKEKERSKERESTECDELVLESEVNVDKKTIIGRSHERQPSNWDVFSDYCIKKGCSHEEAIYFFSTWEASGWTTNDKPIKDWRAKVVSWHTAGYFKKNGTLPNR